MHVAVDARFSVLDTRGIGRYTRTLIAHFLALPDVRLSFVAPGLLAPRGKIAKTLGVERGSVVGSIPADAGVLWSPSNGTDLPTALPCVTTVHDIVPFMFPADTQRVREAEQAPIRRTVERAARILTDSRFVANEIVSRLDVEPERIVPVPLGVGAPFTAAGEKHTLPDGRPYVLHVGAHDMRKNVKTLVAAWQAAFPTADVALAFTRPPEMLVPGSVVIDAPTDEALANVYRGATLVAVPSLDEGFGLPLLEAFACGAPTVASYVAALPEVGGEVTAWIRNADNVDEWSFMFRRLEREPALLAALAARGPAQAAGFTWERCAQSTLDVLRSVATQAR